MNGAAPQTVDRHLARHPNHIWLGSRTDAGVRSRAGTLATAIAASLRPLRAHTGNQRQDQGHRHLAGQKRPRSI